MTSSTGQTLQTEYDLSSLCWMYRSLHGTASPYLMNCCTPTADVVGGQHQWWKYDQNVKTKTKTKSIRPRPRPRPIKQDCIRKKLFCCNTHFCYQKITMQKTSKSDMMTSYVWHCFCTCCTKKIQVFITFQHYCIRQRLVRHNSVGSKTKSIRPM